MGGAGLTNEEFWSFQLVDLAKTSGPDKRKYKFWWWSVRRSFASMSPEKTEIVIALAATDKDNKKSADELREILKNFINEIDPIDEKVPGYD